MKKMIVMAAMLSVALSAPALAASSGYYKGEPSRASAASTHKIGPKKKVASSTGYYAGEPSRASSKSKMKVAPKKPQ